MSPEQRTGLVEEAWVYRKLIEQGYSPTQDPDFFDKSHDMRIKGLPVEVKIAHPTTRIVDGKPYTRWQFSIHPTTTAIRGEWCAVLVAQDRAGIKYPFIVPGSHIGDRSHLQITSHPSKYRGWLAEYKDRWDLIDFLVDEVYTDGGPLFHELAEVA